MQIRFIFNYMGQLVMLPVNPPELEVVKEGANETVEIITLGDVNILRTARLTAMNVSSYFPYFSNHPAVVTKGQFQTPDFYIRFFEQIQRDKKPVELTVTGTGISMNVSVESFSHTYVAQTDDINYTLALKEYKPFHHVEVVLPAQAAASAQQSQPAIVIENNRPPATQITIGSIVILNGQLHRDSYGGSPGMIRNEWKGKVIDARTERPYPYHIGRLTGEWQGWVKAECVRLA